MIECPCCDGQGSYPIPRVSDIFDWEQSSCQVCETLGKITIERYRMIQDDVYFKETCRIESI